MLRAVSVLLLLLLLLLCGRENNRLGVLLGGSWRWCDVGATTDKIQCWPGTWGSAEFCLAPAPLPLPPRAGRHATGWQQLPVQ